MILIYRLPADPPAPSSPQSPRLLILPRNVPQVSKQAEDEDEDEDREP